MRALFVLIFLLVSLEIASAQIFINALMHQDDFIVNDNSNSKIWLQTHVQKAPLAISKEYEINAKNEPNFRTAWKDTLAKAFTQSDAPDIYLLISSHGDQGFVMFNNEYIELKFIAEELAQQAKLSEERGHPRRIHFVYSACYSGSLFSILYTAWFKFRVKSKISVISSGPTDNVSHATILRQYFEKMLPLLHRIEDEGLKYCEGCTVFEKLGRLVASARSVEHQDVPMFWSSDAQVSKTTYEDFLTELKLFNTSSLRIANDSQKIYDLLILKSTSSLILFFYEKNPVLFFTYINELMQIEDLMNRNSSGIELAERMIQIFPKVQTQYSRTTMNESVVGYIAGWILMNKSVKQRSEFFSTLIANWGPKEAPHVVAASRLFKILTLIERGQLNSAVSEYIKLSHIQVGWQHSASPTHEFVSIATSKLIDVLLQSHATSEWSKNHWMSQILNDDETARRFVSKLMDYHRVPTSIKNRAEFVRILLTKQMYYDLPFGIKTTAAIQMLAEMKDDPKQISKQAQDYWISNFKERLLYDSDIELANKLLQLDLPYRQNQYRGQIPYPSVNSCRNLFL